MSMDYSGPSYADLPMEIILRIMDYLNTSDILEASLTCRRWFNASLHPKFLSRIQIHFDKVQISDTQSLPLNVFAECMRYFQKIHLNQVDMDQSCLDFWNRFGDHFTHIEFNECDLREKTLNAILKMLNNLKVLVINNCRELFMSGRLFKNQCDQYAIKDACKNVLSLSLSNNRYLSDALFRRIVNIIENVQSLNLSGCYISFHSALYRKFYPDHQREPSESVFTFFEIMQFIESKASQIKYLDFSETLIDGNALNRLADVKELQLKGLTLASCDQLTNAGISQICQKQKSITSLDLSRSVRFTDPSLLDICRTFSNLKVLKVRRCRAITDLSIKEVRHLKHLEYLDISECNAITSTGFIEGVANEKNNRFIELHVSALNICEKSIIKLAESQQKIMVLDLSFCKNAVTDLAVQMIFKYLLKLKTLNLEFCDMISDAGITGMEMRYQVENNEQTKLNLELNSESDNDRTENDEVDQPELHVPHESINRNPYEISLRGKAELDIINDAKRKKIMLHMYERSLRKEEINCSPYSIACLKGLKSLNLASCNRITDISLKYAFKFIELETLSLSKCLQISAIGMKCIVTNCPSIKMLNLSDCHNMSDQAIDLITASLKRLTYLHIERCSQLTDKSLDLIAINCKRLKYLDVRGCRLMCAEPSSKLNMVRSLQQVLTSKPGPYMTSHGKQPNAPPMPTTF